MQQTRELLGLSDEPSGSALQPLRLCSWRMRLSTVHQMEKTEMGGAEFSTQLAAVADVDVDVDRRAPGGDGGGEEDSSDGS